MPVQVICKFHKDPIKTKKTMLREKIKYGVSRHSRASNSEKNILIWPEFEHIRDFMAVLVTCKFEDDSIKSEGAIFWATFSQL